MDQAARNGHLGILDFLHANRREGCSPQALNGAVANGHDDVAAFLAHEGICLDIGAPLLKLAAERGGLELLQSHRGLLDVRARCRTTLAAAVRRNQVDVAKWLVDTYGHHCSNEVLIDVAELGHLEIIRWAHSEGFTPSPPRLVNSAAFGGHLHILEWAKSVYMTDAFTDDAFESAATAGHLHVVQWLHKNTAAPAMGAMDAAAACGHLEVVKWLHANRTEGCSFVAMNKAACEGHLEVVIWLHENRSEGCSVRAFGGPVHVVRWLYAALPSIAIARSSVRDAVQNGDFELFKCLAAFAPSAAVAAGAFITNSRHANQAGWVTYLQQLPLSQQENEEIVQ